MSSYSRLGLHDKHNRVSEGHEILGVKRVQKATGTSNKRRRFHESNVFYISNGGCRRVVSDQLPVRGFKMGECIESTATKSYEFKTSLQADDNKIQSRDGAVTSEVDVKDGG